MPLLVTHENMMGEVVKSDRHSYMEYYRSSDCIFVELSRTESLYVDVWVICACVLMEVVILDV